MTSEQMWTYIRETPEVAHRLLHEFDSNYADIHFSDVKNVVFVGSGSSLNIATVVTNFYENRLGLSVKTYHPDAFLNLNQVNLPKESTVVVGISQTGTSAGSVAALQRAKELDFLTVAITERRQTPLAEVGHFYFNFGSGEEACNAKTKGYTNSLILLYLLGVKLAGERLPAATRASVYAELEAAVDEIDGTIQRTQDWFDQNRDWVRVESLLLIGASEYLGAISEGSLKTSETTLVPGAFVTVGEFSHGIHRTLNGNTNVILVNSPDDPLEETYIYLKDKVNRVAIIDTTGRLDSGLAVENRLYGISAVNVGVVFQVLAYWLPAYIGNDPNLVINHDYELLVHNRI
ncbi:SIS domain-containing protein [Lacticaseibacillus daqingensis]|uniref:SIS domain-containing protein n=1 Tax=Lacticaseibacillus daqingensis TaxID=2486014 RepID=UPI000F7A058E|nr:SIS domain-containing protein [Lacticaseibacillus daqingensis]